MARNGVSRLDIARAWIGLVMADLVMSRRGSSGLLQAVENWPVGRGCAEEAKSEVVENTCRAVDRAQVYYFKRAWCLQSAAAAVRLLRRAGVGADLVIGVRHVPFAAHAWVEVGSEVVKNVQPTMDLYTEIARC